MECLGWQGSVITRGSIYRHLGYPLGIDVTNVPLIDWIGGKLRDKFMYWKYLSDIWQVLTRCCLRPQQWVFSQYVQNGSNDEMEILFQFLRYWGL